VATNKTETAEIIAELAELYPGAFSTDPSRVRPLAIGVKEMLLQQCKLTPKSIGDVLRRYTGSTGYLKATVEGAARVDLDGQAAGPVTMCQAEHAQRRLAKIAERVAIKPKSTILAAAKPAGAAKGSVEAPGGKLSISITPKGRVQLLPLFATAQGNPATILAQFHIQPSVTR
jgi:sRNA-binding protein